MTTDTAALDLRSMMTDHGSSTPSFAERLRPLMPALLGYFQRRVDPREDAADCLSETVLVLWRQRARLPRTDDDLRAYSYGIARNILTNQRRGRLRHANLHARLRDHFTPTLADPAATDEAHQLLAVLKEKDQELVTLVVLDGLGVAEAGHVLGLRPGAARTRYARARLRLRQHIHTDDSAES